VKNYIVRDFVDGLSLWEYWLILRHRQEILPKTDVDESLSPNYSFGASRKIISPLPDIGCVWGMGFR
jgi:hypothetical protein